VKTGTTAAAGRTRRAATVLLWVAVGTAWLIAWFVPWTSRGLLSTSSLEDVARLVRSGSVSALVPRWAAWLLLLGPASGLVLFATAAVDGQAITAVRCALLVAMSVAFVASWYAVAQLDLDRLGPGGWLTGTGVAIGLAGLAEGWRHTHFHPQGETRP
jgi:hypothetical protein